MSSPSTYYRRRAILSNQYHGSMSFSRIMQSTQSPSTSATNNQQDMELTGCTESNPTTLPTTIDCFSSTSNRLAITATTTNDLNACRRRLQPTLRDTSVLAMIFKIRRLQNNKDIDFLCKLFNVFSMMNMPKDMKAIEKQLNNRFHLETFYECFHICSNCGASNSDKMVICQLCDDKLIFKFYLCSIKKQIQQLLSIPGFYNKLKEEKIKNMHSFSNTRYGEILQEIENDSFTMLINSDGVCTPNKNLSIWPFILMINELPIHDRRYLENITIAGIIPTSRKPTNSVVQTCLRLIYEQLLQLEEGAEFYVNDLDERKILHFYTIASCTDKPAEALMENVVPYNAAYGCPKCFAQGELFHGERGVGIHKRKFHVRVYPFMDFELRNQKKCCDIVQKLIHHSKQHNVNGMNRNKKKKKHSQQTRKGKKNNSYGHYGDCPLTNLKYFEYGKSFLTDSLHTIYAGAFKQLLRLLFDHEYRSQPWSLYEKVNQIDELLSHVQTPSTTQRRFRSIHHISKYKASEYRCLFHFGMPAIIECIKKNDCRILLLTLLAAINLASGDFVTNETIEIVEKLLHYFVQHFQEIFSMRHMSSNIHSLLHVHESLKFIGPLWFYSTFAFEGIDKDLISTVHGTTEFAKQLIRQHILYRSAIILHKGDQYPMELFKFNEELLNRKQSKIHYTNCIDNCSLSNSVSAELYDTSENGIAQRVQSFFKNNLTFYHALIVSNIFIKTTLSMHGKLVEDCCVSFYFNGDQIKYGLVRAIVKSKEDVVRIFIEELIEKNPGSSKLKFKINDEQYQVPNILFFKCSNIFYLKHPKFILKKHAIMCRPGNCVTVLEYPNLKDSS